MKLRVMVSRHSAFYSPLIATIAGGFPASYEVLPAGRRSHALLAEGAVDIIQSAVSSNWEPMERGQPDLPLHFALINRRDGFFLAGREPDAAFHWKKLEGRRLLADNGRQPLAMLRYAAWRNGVDWRRIAVVDAGSPEQMEAAFRSGRGDYVHLQGPAPQQLEKDGAGWIVASVGEAMPPVAFSSLMATRRFLQSASAEEFLRAYRQRRQWVHQAPPEEVARLEASFFPGIGAEALAAAVARYQALGCWDGDILIPRDLYEQALEVFLHSGLITRRHAYEEVVCQ